MVDSRAGEKCNMNLEYLVVLEKKKCSKNDEGMARMQKLASEAQGPNLEQVKHQNDKESYGL